jgi:hypothetical protein
VKHFRDCRYGSFELRLAEGPVNGKNKSTIAQRSVLDSSNFVNSQLLTRAKDLYLGFNRVLPIR